MEHYDLRSNSYIGTSHDPPPDEGSLDDNDDDQTSAVGYRSPLPRHNMGMEDDQCSLGNSASASVSYATLSIEDVSPIEIARARFLDIIVDYFIDQHVIAMSDSDSDYMVQQPPQDKMSKRKSREVRYEGDARYALPLMYVANMYETLVSEVNMRLSSVNSMREKTIGVALEASGGLYRKLSKKYPKKGSCIFKRRELATSLETRSRFPELVIQEEKRVRFVVVNGLAIVEKPSKIGIDDAEWFKRLTGRLEVAISARDYKFYAPRHKYRRVMPNPIHNMPGLPAFPSPGSTSPMSTSQGYSQGNDNPEQTPSKQHMQQLPHQTLYYPLHHAHHFDMNHSPHLVHNQQFAPSSQLPAMAHNQQSSTIAQQITCLPSLGQVGGRSHVLPTSPAKFCDQCGVPYVRETSKFCSACGDPRMGI